MMIHKFLKHFRYKLSIIAPKVVMEVMWTGPEQKSSYISVTALTPGAEDGNRTRDPQLGKLMLYQLSYFRIYFINR